MTNKKIKWNYTSLKTLINDNFKSLDDFISKLGVMSKQKFMDSITNKRDFTRDEMLAIKNLLNIHNIENYFFVKED